MIGGINNSLNQQQTGHVHHVTECVHARTPEKPEGGMKTGSQTATASQQQTAGITESSQTGLLSHLMEQIKSGVRSLGLWLSADTGRSADVSAASAEDSDPTAAAGVAQPGNIVAEKAVSAAQPGNIADAAQPGNTVGEKTAGVAQLEKAAGYFVPLQQEKVQGSLVTNTRERIRIRFASIRNSLAKYLKQEQKLQTKTGGNKEPGKEKQDRSRHSIYRQEDLELECVITDDSYLLDSYDRKGDYSRLGKN